jgi:hypothetical protein
MLGAGLDTKILLGTLAGLDEEEEDDLLLEDLAGLLSTQVSSTSAMSPHRRNVDNLIRLTTLL